VKGPLLIAAAFAALIAGSAIADAQQPRVYRRPVAVPVYSWTGLYVGGNVGYSWGSARTDIAGNGTTISQGRTPANVGFADSNTVRLDGVIGGGQIGYNYQFSPRWLLGFEADIQDSGQRGSNAFTDPFSTQICFFSGPGGCIGFAPANGNAVTAYEGRIDWFGTVRGRLGVLITDQVLLYGTGGLAYGRVELSGITNVNGQFVAGPIPFSPAATSFSDSRTNVGWTAGAGIEGRFASWLPAGWTWKVEYLYMDLGSLDFTAPFPAANPTGGPATTFTTPFTGPLTTHTHFTDNIVRVGLNYKFGYAAAPAVYR
jgi:outer membrane immunogenic protein